MNIYLFSDYTGMVDITKIAPSHKTAIKVGNLTGTITFNGHAYKIEGGNATIPREAFTGDKIEIKVTARVNNFVRHWNVESLTQKNGLYVAAEFASRDIMLKLRQSNEELLADIKRLKDDVSKIKNKLKAPFGKGGTK